MMGTADKTARDEAAVKEAIERKEAELRELGLSAAEVTRATGPLRSFYLADPAEDGSRPT